MARQEIASTFGDGLMMDLNPINTPKSVLTDCLNGTYITYNGNEFVLQNDMGNYKLKNCKLPTNFIPVGVKGYGDILYIVSYNPITKETEIGSYPAPQSIFTSGDTPNRIAEDEDLTPFNWPNDNIQSNTAKYPDIIKLDKKPLFIFTTSEEETFKLNPGDEFKLEGLSDINNLDYIYQHLNFYVIDEDNKLYDLEDNDIYNYSGPYLDNNFRKVFWETPGWLAAQYDLYVPDKFNLNLKSLNVPEFLIINDKTSEQAEGEINPKTQFEASMDLSSQVIITDLLFQNELNKWKVGNHYRDLYIRYKIETISGKFHGFTTDSDITVIDNGDGSYDIPCKWHNYQDDVITAFVNCSPVWWMDNPKDKNNPQNYDGVIAVTAYPIIKYNGKILEFTQFETKLRFPLNTLKNSNNITIADSIYKWSVDDDSCTISFNINGPFINANNMTGEYSILRVDSKNFFNEDIEAKFENTQWKLISNIVLYGQNTINIDFDDDFADDFVKEGGVYILNIRINQNSSKVYNKKMILIPSVAFNEWFGSLDTYETLTTSEWVKKWLDNFNISSFNINSIIFDILDNVLVKDFAFYKWSTDTDDYKPIENSGETVKTFDENDWFTWFKNQLNSHFKGNISESGSSSESVPCVLQSPTSDKLLIKFDYSKILGNLNQSQIQITDNPLLGNLWNPDYEITYDLYSNIDNTTYSLYKNEDGLWNIDLNNLTQIIEISFTNTSHNGAVLEKRIYPFRKGYIKNNKVIEPIALSLRCCTYDNDRTKTQYARWINTSEIDYDRARDSKDIKTAYVGKALEKLNQYKVNMFLGAVWTNNGKDPGWFLAGDINNTTNFTDSRTWRDPRYGVFVKCSYRMSGVSNDSCYFVYDSSDQKNGFENAPNIFYTLWNMYYNQYSNTNLQTYIISANLSNNIQDLIQITLNRYNIKISLNSLKYKINNGVINSWYDNNDWSNTNIIPDDIDVLGIKLINGVTNTISNKKELINNIFSSSVILNADIRETDYSTFWSNLSSAILSKYNSIVQIALGKNEEVVEGWQFVDDSEKETYQNAWFNKTWDFPNEANLQNIKIDSNTNYTDKYKSSFPEKFGNNALNGNPMSENDVWYNVESGDVVYLAFASLGTPGPNDNAGRIAAFYTNE